MPGRTPISNRVLIAADWSAHPAGRAACMAEPRQRGYLVSGPFPGDAVVTLAAGRPALIGLDVPIGLPAAYCRLTGVASFRELLPALGRHAPWAEFFDVSDTPTLHRPFYPRTAAGSTRRGLGLDWDNCLRQCDRLARASPLFWTVGARQVGRAAIAAWRHLLQPRREDWAIWPFDGPLNTLPRAFAELYPARAGRIVGLPRIGGKRHIEARRTAASYLLHWTATHGLELTAGLRECVEAGFADDNEFDAFVSVLALTVPAREPVLAADQVQREGWILGLTA